MQPTMQRAVLLLGMAMGGHALTASFSSARAFPHPQQPASHYCHNVNTFSNKRDFAPASKILEAFFKNSDNVTMFTVGTYDGGNLLEITKKAWYDADKARIYGWEITQGAFQKAVDNLKGHPEIILDRAAISDSDGQSVTVSGGGETAGVYAPGPHGFQAANESVKTLQWSTFTRKEQIKHVTYALIDVEGHEMAVIAGMHLETSRDMFPVFQYELGGTWVDGRHAGNMSQAHAAEYLGAGNNSRSLGYHRTTYSGLQVTQQLVNLGYHIYVMGTTAGTGIPVLAPVGPSAFKDANCVQEGGKFFVQGNALAIKEDAFNQMPWLLQVVDEMVANDAQLS